MAQFPSEIEALVQRGIAAAKEGKNGIAQQFLHKAVELAPTHEQAWLWLSGVEDTDQKKLAALEHVLSINPSSTLARQGIERLTQPKQIDLAQIAASSAAPAPARAAKIASDPPPPPPMPAIKPPTQPLATPAEPIPASIEQATATPAMESQAEPEVRGMQALEDLKPAMERAKKKRSFLPRMSEMVIMAGLLVLLLGAIIGLRTIFNPDKYNVAQDRINQTLQERTAQAGQPRTQAPVAVQPTVPLPIIEVTQPPAPPANTMSSRSYQLQFGGAAVNADQKNVAVNVTLNNPLQRPLTFSNIDFSARNGTNAALRLDLTQSTLFAGEKTIPANGSVSGSLVFVGDVTKTPLTMVWQPQGGGVRQEIPIQ